MGLLDKLKEINKKNQIKKVIKNPSYIAYKKNPSEELQLVAVDNYDYIINKLKEYALCDNIEDLVSDLKTTG